MSLKSKVKNSDIFIIVIVVLIIIILIISAGKLDFTKKDDDEITSKPKQRILTEDEIQIIIKKQELTKLKEDKENKQTELNQLIDKKAKCDKRYRLLYFFTRLSLIIAWLIPFILFTSFKKVNDFACITNLIDSLLNYTQFIILSVLVLNFVITGSISNISKIGKGIANTVKNLVYRNIEFEISDLRIEFTNLENEIKDKEEDINGLMLRE